MNTIETGTEELLCRLEDRVAIITLNRPKKKNALSDHLTPALRQTLLDLETKREVGCILITGSGDAFCAGGDIGGMGGNASKDEEVSERPTAEERVRALIHKQETLTLRLADHAKPTIAALPGRGGCWFMHRPGLRYPRRLSIRFCDDRLSEYRFFWRLWRELVAHSISRAIESQRTVLYWKTRSIGRGTGARHIQ